jgi:hypothetical protein
MGSYRSVVATARSRPPARVAPPRAHVNVRGNLTLLGSVANVIVFEIARERCAIGFWRFLAIGAPITVLTTAVGLVAVWALT